MKGGPQAFCNTWRVFYRTRDTSCLEGESCNFSFAKRCRCIWHFYKPVQKEVQGFEERKTQAKHNCKIHLSVGYESRHPAHLYFLRYRSPSPRISRRNACSCHLHHARMHLLLGSHRGARRHDASHASNRVLHVIPGIYQHVSSLLKRSSRAMDRLGGSGG